MTGKSRNQVKSKHADVTETPRFGLQVWPPPDNMIDDEGYPMSMADYLDDSELLTNYNKLQGRVKEHLTAMRTGLNLPLPPTAENRKACAMGKLSAKSLLENRSPVTTTVTVNSNKTSTLPMFPLLGPGTCSNMCYEQLAHKYLGCCELNQLSCTTLSTSPTHHCSGHPHPRQHSPTAPTAGATKSGKKKKQLKNHTAIIAPENSSNPDNLCRIYALGAELAREICAKSPSEKEDSSCSCTVAPDDAADCSVTTKAASSTSSGCESTADAQFIPDCALTPELQPWYNDQLTALALGLTRRSSQQPILYNGRPLHTEAQVAALLKAFFQAGQVMGRMHALRLSMETTTTTATEQPPSNTVVSQVPPPQTKSGKKSKKAGGKK